MLEESGYSGPIIQNFEYEVEGRTKKEKQKNLIKSMKKDYTTLKSWLKDTELR